jgi:hypothetical protein
MAINLLAHPTQSVLYRAAFTASPVPQQPVDPNVLFYKYKVKDIIGFILKVHPQGVTFEELQRYPKTNLNPLHKELLGFFTRDVRYFNRFASIYPDYDKLSADDFRVAARLGSQMNPQKAAQSTRHGIDTFFQHPHQATGRTDQADTAQDKSVSVPSQGLIDRPDQFSRVSRVTGKPGEGQPDTGLTRQNMPVTRQPKAPGEVASIPLTSRAANGPMASAPPAEPSEAIKALVARSLPPDHKPSLMWQPSDQSPHLTAADGTVRSIFHPDTPFEQTDYNQTWRVSVRELADLLRHIDRQGEVSLAALRAYQPASPQEARMMQYLRQMDVFKALAHLDDLHANTLDLDDIKVMADRHMLVLTDAHLSVFVVD